MLKCNFLFVEIKKNFEKCFKYFNGLRMHYRIINYTCNIEQAIYFVEQFVLDIYVRFTTDSTLNLKMHRYL